MNDKDYNDYEQSAFIEDRTSPHLRELEAEINRDEYSDREQKQREKQEKAEKNVFMWLLLTFLKSFYIDPKTVRGHTFVTPKADKESRLLATTGSITNLIGTIGIAPIIIFTMTNLGVLSLPIAITLLYLLNSIQNAYTIAVARKAGNRKMRDRSGLIGIIGMQVILTDASLVGMLLLNSQATLSNVHADQRAESKREQILEQKEAVLASPETLEIKRRCEKGKQDIKNAAPNDPNRHRFIIETHGSWDDTQRLGVPSTPESYCGKWDTLRQEIQDTFDAVLEPHNQAESQGKTPVAILKIAYPDTYRSEFIGGKIADGNTAIAVGFSYAVKQIISGKVSSLGSSLLFLALSATTSTALIVGLLVHSRRDAIIVSFSDDAEYVVTSFFTRYASLIPQSDEEREALEVISRYHQQHVAQGGVVAIPSLIEFVRLAAQQGAVQLTDFPAPKAIANHEGALLLQSLDDCAYQLRTLLHSLATAIKPYSYGLQTSLNVTANGITTGDTDEFIFAFGQALRQLQSIVQQIAKIAKKAKKDTTALVAREKEVADLFSPDQLKQQLCMVERMQPQSFLHARLESLDRLQTGCHSLLH